MRRYVLVLVGLAACASPAVVMTPAVAAARYADAAMWLCLPGREDACAGDLSVTELAADGSSVVLPVPRPIAEPPVDCFYVYPTVDLGLLPGNHSDFADTRPMATATLAQVGRLRSVCRLFVPLYRQATIGSYLHSANVRERHLAVAAADIDAALGEYLRQHNHGRPIVLVGHSQGADMVTRLLKHHFDEDAALRKQLVIAMAIGGWIEVEKGKTVSGSFAHIPVCTGNTERGCVIGYRTIAAGATVDPHMAPPAPGHETICVNPAELAHGTSRFQMAVFPTSTRRGRARNMDGITTPYVALPDFYRGRCVDGKDGYRFLEIAADPAPGDVRKNPIDFSAGHLSGSLGLHVLDFQFAQGDLAALIAARSAP